MCLTGSLIGCRCCVAPEHLRAPPTHQPHQVRLAAAARVPTVRCGVTKLVGMQTGDAGFVASSLEHLPDPVSAERAPAIGKPECWHSGPAVPIPQAQVPTQ